MPLFAFDTWLATAAHFPYTRAQLERVGGLRTALFSRLDPGARLVPHYGYDFLANGVLRCHIVLQCDRCYVEVRGERRYARTGDTVVFDDSQPHSAGNEAARPRVVLLLDVDRPPHVPRGTSESGGTPELASIVREFGVAPEVFARWAARAAPAGRLDVGLLVIGRDEALLPRVVGALSASVAAANLDARVHVAVRRSEARLCRTVEDHTPLAVVCSQVDDYVIHGRHDVEAIARKRNLILDRAIRDARGAVLFVDSDVLLREDTAGRLWGACASHDVCAAAYRPVWAAEPLVAVGEVDSFRLVSAHELPDGCVPMAGTSMGCVLLRGAALEVPFAYHRDERTGVHGEDVGYLRVANERGLRMCALGRYEVRHLDA